MQATPKRGPSTLILLNRTGNFMKTHMFPIALAGSLLLLPGTGMTQPSNEHPAVDRMMQALLHGFEAGDANVVFESFRKDGVVIGYAPAAKRLTTQTAEQWATGFTGVPADDEAQRHRSYQILDVDGDAAVVKLRLDYPGWNGTDYLALLKIDGQWQVVSKSWSGQRKP